MMVKTPDCYIAGAGSFDGMTILPEKEDLVIAADGGYTYLKQAGIEPDVLLGDFDSIDRIPVHKNTICHPPEKDDTDMALAVAYGKEKGCRRFFIYGGLGGRLDHTIANIQLLTGMSKDGLETYLIGEGIIVTALTKEKIVFDEASSGTISVFAMGEKALGVSETGLKYCLDHAELTCDRALGVSNEFTGQKAEISVESGTLLLIWNAENGIPVERVYINR